MAVRVKLGRSNHPLWQRLLVGAGILLLLLLIVGGVVYAVNYHEYEGLVDQRLAQGPLFTSTAQVYAAPQEIRPGQALTAESIAASLRKAGYNTNPQMGNFEQDGEQIKIKPGPQSYLAGDGATVDTTGGSVQSITAEDGKPFTTYKLEPQLITALSEDKNRTKRRLVTYDQIPQRMVQAVVAIEDRRFFEHGGINYGRTIKCVVHDVMVGRKDCGGSTLTQQLAKNFFLSPDKKVSRKIAELMITFQLESRFNKKQIFEMYANEINIGQRGSFAINGFGEAAQAYFGKDLRQLSLAECALLAGIVNRPNRLNPYRHADAAIERRNLVLDSMVETGAITRSEADEAKAEPLHLAPANVDASEAPYFVDMVHDQIASRIGEYDSSRNSLRIYTSLDPDLQRAASDAVQAGMPKIDELIRRLRKKGAGPAPTPQVALVALNPHTGQILALVGGRSYAASQLNHALSPRPTGSIFKPFVYATAFNTSLNGMSFGDDGSVFTAISRINDDPQDFGGGYTPHNFDRGEMPGMVTVADALAHSLNIATIAIAQKVGYGNVVSLAHTAGITSAKPTPSMAIGTYSATPIDMAGAYTLFANNGVHIKPWLLGSVRNAQGDVVSDFTPDAHQVIDPKVAYLTQSLMEGVMTRGTGSATRRLGFLAPAAGKTGTEHDAWFAGYSSNLLCIVWIGNDDYTDLSTDLTHHVQAADTAAPIWAEFMKRAIKLPQYSDMKALGPMPEGVQMVRIDQTSGLPADQSCPDKGYMAAFLVGTLPNTTCSHMIEDPTQVGNRIYDGYTGGPQPQPYLPPQPGSSQPGTPQSPYQPSTPSSPPQPHPIDMNQPAATPAEEHHRNAFQKLFGLGKKKNDQEQQQPQ